MIRPFQVTTYAAVIAPAGSNAASTACLSLAASIEGGSGSAGTKSPIGHFNVDAGGSALRISTGEKWKDVAPSGSVAHPWLPRNRAVRVRPLGIETVTDFAARSTTGLPSFARSGNGAV